MGGSKSPNDSAVFPASTGQGGAAFHPGGRAQPAYARDAQGNLWLFGGTDSAGNHNDLWKFDIATRQWSWMSGTQTPEASGSYGTKGVADSTNVPGARDAAAAWFDASGNFWLFGGIENSPSGDPMPLYLNDLWKYDVAHDLWTWVGGANAGDQLDALGVYATTPSTANIPGGRGEMAVAQDPGGAVWLFGGIGYGAENSWGRPNDLWRFDPATRVWSWMGGDNDDGTTREQGQLGVESAMNQPNGRPDAALWADGAGRVWMFGGSGLLTPENDLWRFNTANGQWTWMGGTDLSFALQSAPKGTYEAPGTTSSNYPRSRYAAASWRDASGDLWLFGGLGAGTSNPGPLNDLWKYSPATNTWEWLSGSYASYPPSVYGTQGTANMTNTPGGRYFPVAWTDNIGHLWLWGGIQGILPARIGSDMWYATPP